MRSFYKTAKGTDLPLLNLRGREYLEVKYRLVWFREEHPDWTIETNLISVSDKDALVRAEVRNAEGRLISTSHKFENAKGFPDFIEKSETGAIGRALALIGYGTSFCADELDEGERVVDAPSKPISAVRVPIEGTIGSPDPGEFKVPVGTRYMGRKIKDIPEEEMRVFINYCSTTAVARGQVTPDQLNSLRSNFEAFVAMKRNAENISRGTAGSTNS